LSAWTTSPLVVGHRGGRGEGWPPENTLAAFERARAEGARAIELDVRTCAEGIPVVFHDPTLARMTGNRYGRRVCDIRLEELQAIDLGDGVRVPTLSEVLGWARERDVAVNVELKHDVPERNTLARNALRAVRAQRADVLLSSFDPVLLAAALAFGPGIPRALLVHEGQSRWAGALQEVVRPPLVGSLHLERKQGQPRAIARYRRRRLRLGAWTVNDPREALDLVRLGVASIITDCPGAILGALRSLAPAAPVAPAAPAAPVAPLTRT
jgi:glycerophosphoryl diester phosphodiesterase